MKWSELYWAFRFDVQCLACGEQVQTPVRFGSGPAPFHHSCWKGAGEPMYHVWDRKWFVEKYTAYGTVEVVEWTPPAPDSLGQKMARADRHAPPRGRYDP